LKQRIGRIYSLLGAAAAAACLLLLASWASADTRLDGSTESIPRNAITSAGSLATSAGLSFHNALAENAVSSFSGAGFQFYSGLMNISAQPGTITTITALSKSTGTLELAWTAPGLDGFLGDVTAGYYRIAYSSDPAQVSTFSPLNYTVEFPTVVVPNSPQSYTLTGLQPNTTYFAQVYLSDARKYVAEKSPTNQSSTLANVPPPVISGVFYSSVTISWTLPVAYGAEGFRVDSSTTNFGSLYPGGTVVSSVTNSGVVVTLTLAGLNSGTTYFFKLGSLNWQQDVNYTNVLATCTLPGGVPPIFNLASISDPNGLNVRLTWSSPSFPNPNGVLIQVSANPITSSPVDGMAYAPGSVFPDGAVVGSTAVAASFLQTGMQLDVTSYFALYNKNTSNTYSVAVSTYVVLDLPPFAAAGLQADLPIHSSTITLTWARVTSNWGRDNGPAFHSTTAPASWELSRYDIYRATGIVHASWVYIGSAPVDATSYASVLPDPSARYYFKVVPVDSFNTWADCAMAIDTAGDIYSVAPDGISRLAVPVAMAGALKGNNQYGKPILICADEFPGEVGGRIIKSVKFASLQFPDKAGAPQFRLPDAKAEVVLRYETVANQVVPSAAGVAMTPSSIHASVLASDAGHNLGPYFYNGQDYVQLYGSVDTTNQTVSLLSALPGHYQIRAVAVPSEFDFDIAGISNKIITPNGDGLNDTVIFVFNNPKDSAVEGKIFDIRGAFVADMKPSPAVAESLMWDGMSGGRVVSGGVYIYQIRADDKTFNGTVVVVR